MKNNGSGFTLIELMIVVAIIGILGAIALPHFSKVRERARESKCWEYSSLLTRTLELYLMENKIPPGETLAGKSSEGGGLDFLKPYIANKRIPICPSAGHYVITEQYPYNTKVMCPRHPPASYSFGG